jgi:2',3'-cyclic-nucleotide 2'-phosphodiesterase (5'-nucleotidase family)
MKSVPLVAVALSATFGAFGCAWPAPVVVLVTADREGVLVSCGSCGEHALGSVARQGMAIARLRGEFPSLLLVDAGDAFFGGASVDDGGRAVVRAYEALRYDVVNLSYRDFRSGKAETLRLLAGTRFQAVSTNLVDAATGAPLVRPYVVVTSGGVHVAFVGLTEVPARAEELPHLRTQLAGVTARGTVEALREWLPKAGKEADHTILLYYGSASGLEEVRRAFPSGLSAILVGGLRPSDVPSGGEVPILATQPHGTQLGQLRVVPFGATSIGHIDLDAAFNLDADPLLNRNHLSR